MRCCTNVCGDEFCGIPRARLLAQDAPWNGLRSSHAARRSHRYYRHACHRSRHHRRLPSWPPRGPWHPTALLLLERKQNHHTQAPSLAVACCVECAFSSNRRASSASMLGMLNILGPKLACVGARAHTWVLIGSPECLPLARHRLALARGPTPPRPREATLQYVLRFHRWSL